MVKHAVILMAGKGTRFLPATKAIAKEMFPIGSKPALLYHLKECLDSGIKEVTIVISKQKKDVIKFLKHDKELENLIKGTSKEKLLEEWCQVVDNLKINFAYQGKKINGSAGAVWSIKKFVKNEPFALMFGDDVYIPENNQEPALKELIKANEKTNKYVLGCVKVSDDVVDRYGVAVVSGVDNGYELVKGFKEKPKKGTQPSNLASLGRYIILPSVFENILKCEKHENGEVYLPEAIAMECEKNNVVACSISAKYNDLGNKLEFVKCTINEALKDKEIEGQLKEYLNSLKF